MRCVGSRYRLSGRLVLAAALVVLACAVCRGKTSAKTDTRSVVATTPPPTESSSRQNPSSNAVAVSVDLALMPDGKVVSLTTGEIVTALGTLSRLRGQESAGCGLVRVSSAVRCWSRDVRGRIVVEDIARAGTARDISGTLEAGCAIKSSGPVLCWDRNETTSPENSLPSGEPRRTPDLDSPPKPAPLSRPVHFFSVPMRAPPVALAGTADGCAIDILGGVSCWGLQWKRRLGRTVQIDRRAATPVIGVHGARRISQSGGTRCATTENGEVLCWGLRLTPARSTAGYLDEPPDEKAVAVRGIGDAVDISIFAGLACVVTRGGKVVCWGATSCHSDEAEAIAVSSTPSGFCAIRRAGGLSCQRCQP
jgi:hypothetical protein